MPSSSGEKAPLITPAAPRPPPGPGGAGANAGAPADQRGGPAAVSTPVLGTRTRETLTPSAVFNLSTSQRLQHATRESDDMSVGSSTSIKSSFTRARESMGAFDVASIFDGKWLRSLGGSFSRPRSGYERMMDRDAQYHQSFGRWKIRKIRKGVPGIASLFAKDRFHTVLNMATGKVVLLIFVVYILAVSLFAFFYFLMSRHQECNLGINDMGQAYFFSLETMTTVGYGTQDVFFGGCWTVMIVISVQACCSLLLDAALIGMIFARLSRPQTRASTVVFSNFAVIRRIRGEFFFMFQVGELRKHQLLETHIRCYAVRHDRTLPLRPDGSVNNDAEPETVHYQTHNMRLQHPDDELGSQLLLVLPQVVVHRIEAWSPLMPPPRWVSEHGLVTWGLHPDTEYRRAPWEHRPSGHHRTTSMESEGLPEVGPMMRRQSTYWEEQDVNLLGGDSDDDEEGGDCGRGTGYIYRFPDLLKRWDDVDGERGTWYERMKRRLTVMEQVRLQQERMKQIMREKHEEEEKQSAHKKRMKSRKSIITISTKQGEQPLKAPGFPTLASPPSPVSEAMTANTWFAREEKAAIQAYMLDRELEVLVIVEGIDMSTGSTVQCRHSYAIENVLWDHSIGPCVMKDDDGYCTVDFGRFHDVAPCAADCLDAGFVQSYA